MPAFTTGLFTERGPERLGHACPEFLKALDAVFVKTGAWVLKDTLLWLSSGSSNACVALLKCCHPKRSHGIHVLCGRSGTPEQVHAAYGVVADPTHPHLSAQPGRGFQKAADEPLASADASEKNVRKTRRRTSMLETMDSEPQAPPENPEAYLRQLALHERWLATYVYSLVAHSYDAEDVLQEIKLTLWRHFAKFQAGTNFRAWARTIALHQILNFRRSAKRHAGAALEEIFVEAVALELDRQALALESQSDLLGRCLQKLPEAHRKLIIWRYYEDCSVAEIATRSRRSVEAVYRLLSRIRAVLSACVQRRTLEV